MRKQPKTVEEANLIIDEMYRFADKIGFICQSKSGWDDPAMRRHIGKLVCEIKSAANQPQALTF